MKKIFTLCFVVALATSLSAQTVNIRKLWDHSIHGTADWSMGFPNGGSAPAWMGNTTERGMAHFDGKLYIPSRNSSSIIVLDAATGNKIKDIPIDAAITGGTYPFNDIAITEFGDILLCNLTTSSVKSAFKVYLLTDDGSGNYATVSTLIEWTSPAGTEEAPEPDFRLGDGFGVFGDIAQGNGYVITANNGIPARVFRWTVTNGVVDPTPTTFEVQNVLPAPAPGTQPKIGLNPKFWPVTDELVWIDGHSIVPGLYNMSGNQIMTFDVNGALPKTGGISGVSYFDFKDKSYLWLPTSNHVVEPKAAFELFEVPATGLADATSHGIYPEKGLGGATNASYAGPVAIDVQMDKVLLFSMSPNNGIAAFELTIDGATDIFDTKEDKVEMYPNPATERVNFSKRMVQVEIYDLAGKLAVKYSDVVEINVSNLQGVYVVKGIGVNGGTICKKLLVK